MLPLWERTDHQEKATALNVCSLWSVHVPGHSAVRVNLQSTLLLYGMIHSLLLVRILDCNLQKTSDNFHTKEE